MRKPISADEQIALGHLLVTLWGGKTLLALCTALGVAASALFIANTTPIYQADALLQLEEKSGMLALPSSLSGMVDSDPRSVTEIEILRSRMVLGQAVADRDLDRHVEAETLPLIGTLLARHPLAGIDVLVPARFARPGEGVMLDELLVPPAWLNRDIGLIVEDGARFTLHLPDGSIEQGVTGVRLTQDATGFSLIVAAILAPPGRAFRLRQLPEQEAIAALRARLSVSERGRGSGILEARLTGPDRVETAIALDAIIRSYLRQNIARSAAEAESSLSFLTEQLPQAERNLRAAETALNSFRQAQVTVDLTLETQSVLEQVTRIEAELAALQRREDELRQRYTEAHPLYRQLLDERGRLATRLEGLRARVAALPETQRQVVNLSRNVELAQGVYTELLTRAQEVEVLRASTIGNVRIIDMAATGRAPVAPRRLLVLAIGAALGFALGAGVVMLRRWLRKGLKDSHEIEATGLPLFATVNHSKLADTGRRRKGPLPILAVDHPTDLTIEALRSLRTSLYFGLLDAGAPTVCITSAHPQAGKSFLSVNMAVVAAQAGQRVCLIDADLRRGQLRRYFDLPRETPGLAEVIAGESPVAQALIPGPVEGLCFLPTGRYPPNPSEMLMRGEFARLMAWCGENFDLTIVDTPPILAVTDPTIVARAMGATLFVARHDMTQIAEVDAAIKTLAAAGLQFTGAVLNGFDPRKARWGYGGGYGYGYRYDYKTRGE